MDNNSNNIQLWILILLLVRLFGDTSWKYLVCAPVVLIWGQAGQAEESHSDTAETGKIKSVSVVFRPITCQLEVFF